MEAFRKVESKARKSYYYNIPGEKSEREDIRVNPLVTDFNPGLPNIGRILNRHKHILKLDPVLCKVVDPDGIFAFFRGAKTIHDKFVHSKLPVLESSTEEIESIEQVKPIAGCTHCDAKKCDICNNFLKQTKTAYSFHTN